MIYTVKDLAKISGLTPYTIRYYCKIGLLGDTQRNENGVREFNNDDILTLMCIIYLKKLKMPLEEMKECISLLLEKRGTPEEKKAFFEIHKQRLIEQRDYINSALSFLDNQDTYFALARESIIEAMDSDSDYNKIRLSELEAITDKVFSEFIKSKTENQ